MQNQLISDGRIIGQQANHNPKKSSLLLEAKIPLFECQVIRAPFPIASNKTENNPSYQVKCTLRLFNFCLKICDMQNGVEEVINLTNKSRIQWIQGIEEYKNTLLNFDGFILSLSLEPETTEGVSQQRLPSQQQEHQKSTKTNNVEDLKQYYQSISASRNNNQNSNSPSANTKNSSSPIKRDSVNMDKKKNDINSSTNNNNNNFSYKSLNLSSHPNIQVPQKNQLVCYFADPQSKQFVVSYFKARVIQRNFHSVYQAVRKLGKGSFASVYLVRLRDTDRHFAVKAFLKERLQSEEKGYLSFYNEIKLMRSVKQKHVLWLIEAWESDNSFYLITPACRGGSLLDRIVWTKRLQHHPELADLKKIPPINAQFVKVFLKQALQGLIGLKQQGIMHRDIKPENMLLDGKLSSMEDEEVRIIDFGLAALANDTEYLYPKCGTPGFVAPEIINLSSKKKAGYNWQCDIFSLGAVLYFMLTLRPLFYGKSARETVEMNKLCVIDFGSKYMTSLDPKILDLLKKMLAVNPNERITAEDALKHKYFIDNFGDEEDLEVPDDEGKTCIIDSTLLRLNQEKVFDMSRINNHVSSQLSVSKLPLATSNNSFYQLDGSGSSSRLFRKSSGSCISSLILRQPVKGLGNDRQPSLVYLNDLEGLEDEVMSQQTRKDHNSTVMPLQEKGMNARKSKDNQVCEIK